MEDKKQQLLIPIKILTNSSQAFLVASSVSTVKGAEEHSGANKWQEKEQELLRHAQHTVQQLVFC